MFDFLAPNCYELKRKNSLKSSALHKTANGKGGRNEKNDIYFSGFWFFSACFRMQSMRQSAVKKFNFEKLCFA